MKRSGKFYRKNEQEIMKRLGLQPTINSGSGWIQKEDGESEEILCQLKSTDVQSIKINKLDIDKLLHNASVSHKIPVFAIQFLCDNKIYLVIRPEDLQEVSEYIDTKSIKREQNLDLGIDLSEIEEYNINSTRKVESSKKARENFNLMNERKFKKKGRSAI